MSRPSRSKLSHAAARSLPSAAVAGQSGPRWLSPAICVFLALAVWGVFGQTLHHDFVNYDDDVYVVDNDMVQRGISWAGVRWAFTRTLNDNWHPLTTLSHMLDCQMYRLRPWGHHLTSVVLHGCAAVLLFLVLRKMTGAVWRGAFVAAVFAIHPLRVESVAWVAERKDVLSGLFFMLTLWAYAGHARPPGRKSEAGGALSPVGSPFYCLALLFFGLGLLSKPMLVTLPFVLLLLDYWPLDRVSRSGWLRLGLEKIPFFLLSAAACAATLLAQRHAMRSAQKIDFPARLGNALAAYAGYIGQMFYPAGLSVFYPHPGKHLSMVKAGWSALVLGILSAGVMAGRRKHPYLLTGWLWYLGMLLPVIGIVQVGSQARADRYTYLPQIGLYILLAWGTADWCAHGRWRRVALAGAAAAILAGLFADARAQTAYWQDSVSLWTRSLAGTPDNLVALNNLGLALAGQGKLGEAMTHYQRALELAPDDVEAHINLGNALAGQGRPDEAMAHYEQALRLNPDNAKAHFDLALALSGQGKPAEAVAHYERALQLQPDFADAHNNLGNVLAGQGRFAEAMAHYEQALRLKPNDADVHYNLSSALADQGKPAEAIAQLQQALTLATAQNRTAMAAAIRRRLQSYQSALPGAGAR